MEANMYTFLKTDDSISILILRLTLALTIFPHGAQKLLGWFGGFGFDGTIGFFTAQMGLPWVIGFLVIMGESFGSLALLTGLLTRFTAASLGVIMVGAIVLVHWPHGFFMNWFGKQGGEGFEYHLLVLGMSTALVISGGGRWAFDAMLARWFEKYRQGSGGIQDIGQAA
jgi:putative oxidoreductase